MAFSQNFAKLTGKPGPNLKILHSSFISHCFIVLSATETGSDIFIQENVVWWNTLWFKFGMLALLLFAALIVHRFRTKTIQARSKRLHDMNSTLIQQNVEIQRAKDALEKSEEKYRTLMENINVGIYRRFPPPDDRFIEVNPAMIQMFDFETKEEFIQLTVFDLYFNPEDIERLDNKMKAQGFLKSESALLKRKDGTPMWCSVSAVVVQDEHGNPLYYDGTIRDITEQKEFEEQVRQIQKMEAVGQLAGGIAHDFNNILTAMTGHAELMLMQLKPGDQYFNSLNEILKSGERAHHLTQHLITFSRRQPIAPRSIELNKVIIDLQAMMRRLIGEDIEITTVLFPNIPPIMADLGQIEQVFINLIINARDAIREHTDTFALKRITIETYPVHLDRDYIMYHPGTRRGPYVVIAVSDTGVGMEEHIREKIFEPFFTTKKRGKGVGFGLATVFGIVKQNRGNIFAYSELGRGATFKIYWPILEGFGKSETGKDMVKGDLRGAEYILVVEDDRGVRKFMVHTLQSFGYRVLEATNGIEAMAVCQRDSINVDMIISDLVMPKMGGLELARRMHVIKPEIKILLTSGYSRNHLASQEEFPPVVDFIEKPYSIQAFVKKVRSIFDVEQPN